VWSDMEIKGQFDVWPLNWPLTSNSDHTFYDINVTFATLTLCCIFVHLYNPLVYGELSMDKHYLSKFELWSLSLTIPFASGIKIILVHDTPSHQG